MNRYEVMNKEPDNNLQVRKSQVPRDRRSYSTTQYRHNCKKHPGRNRQEMQLRKDNRIGSQSPNVMIESIG